MKTTLERVMFQNGKTNDKSWKVFLARGEVTRNAHLDWLGEHQSAAMADGYRISGDLVVEGALASSFHPDKFFYPAAFLYRHAIELQLKFLINLALQLHDEEVAPRPHHKLSELWQEARSHIVRVWSEADQGDLEVVDDVIKEYAEIDPDGQGFRYSETKNGVKNLSNAPRVVSLEHLKEQIAKAFIILEGCEAGMSHYLDIKHELENEYRNAGY